MARGWFAMGFMIVFDGKGWISDPFHMKNRFSVDTRPPEDLPRTVPNLNPGSRRLSSKILDFSLILHDHTDPGSRSAGGPVEVWRWSGCP